MPVLDREFPRQLTTANNPLSQQTLTPAELCTLMQNNDHDYDHIVIVDVRFPYEYEGGHIDGAINVTSPDDLYTLYRNFQNFQNVLIVFYCEFSVSRSPKIMGLFREYDRMQHMEDYPHLSYPNIRLLQGGYHVFYEQHRGMCTGGYVGMSDQAHREDCRLHVLQFNAMSRGPSRNRPRSNST